MAKNNAPSSFDRSLVIAFILVLVFASPLADLWSNPRMPWYLPYLLWFLFIALGGWIHWRERNR